MSGKFAPITASLLARKGAAGPSTIFKSSLDWHAPILPRPHIVPETRPHIAQPAPEAASHRHDETIHRDDAHYLRKIQIGLSDNDHERLRILSARRETSRQQIVRDALVAYFEKQAHDYHDECRCLSGSGPCRNGCSPG
jgi:hypothetical protein